MMYFGVNSDVIAPGPPRDEAPEQQMHVVSMGSDKTRDWKTLLAAFGNDPRFRLTIVCWRLTEADIAGYDNVYLSRITNRTDFVACYRSADMAVVPMTKNIFSGITSALDAVAAGVPLIATRTGGVPTYFNEDEVCYVPVGDPTALRNAVISSTPAERQVKASRALGTFVDRGYSHDGLARRYCAMSLPLLGLGPK